MSPRRASLRCQGTPPVEGRSADRRWRRTLRPRLRARGDWAHYALERALRRRDERLALDAVKCGRLSDWQPGCWNWAERDRENHRRRSEAALAAARETARRRFAIRRSRAHARYVVARAARRRCHGAAHFTLGRAGHSWAGAKELGEYGLKGRATQTPHRHDGDEGSESASPERRRATHYWLLERKLIPR